MHVQGGAEIESRRSCTLSYTHAYTISLHRLSRLLWCVSRFEYIQKVYRFARAISRRRRRRTSSRRQRRIELARKQEACSLGGWESIGQCPGGCISATAIPMVWVRGWIPRVHRQQQQRERKVLPVSPQAPSSGGGRELPRLNTSGLLLLPPSARPHSEKRESEREGLLCYHPPRGFY